MSEKWKEKKEKLHTCRQKQHRVSAMIMEGSVWAEEKKGQFLESKQYQDGEVKRMQMSGRYGGRLYSACE